MDDTPPLPADPIFTTSQAFSLGWTRRSLAEAAANRLCHNVLRGYYAHGPAPSDRRRLHLASVRATHDAYAGRLVTSGASACLWHGLPVDERDLGKVLVTRRRPGTDEAPASHGTSSRWVLVRSAASAEDILPGAPVLTVAAAIVEYGLQAGLPAAVAAGDAALRSGATTEDEISAAVARRAGRAGIRAVAAALPSLLDPRAESVGESRGRLALVRAGFELESQVWIETDEGWYRADWRIRGTAVLVEFDGVDKLVTVDLRLDRAKVRRDRARDRALEATDHVVVHLTMDDALLTSVELRALVLREAGEAMTRPTPPTRSRVASPPESPAC